MRQKRLPLTMMCLLMLRPSCHVCESQINCSSSSVTKQLSKSDIVRTWQPDGDCQRWPNGRSETNRFPAAVRSGPRWLVMQLRQPMVLDRVSVRGRGGQWQAAGAVDSPVSAVGAASLSLELQLEDPCNASWEAFGSSDRWRLLGEARNGTENPISYLLLNSSTEALDWSGINVTGRPPSLSLAVRNDTNNGCPQSDLSALSEGCLVCFSVTSCLNGRVRCFFSLMNGLSVPLQQLNPNSSLPAEFRFAANFSLHGATLSCRRDFHAASTERTIGIVVHPQTLSLSVSPVWVSGRSVSVRVTSVLGYPAQLHECRISAGASSWNLAMSSTQIFVTANSHNRTVVTQNSEFRFNVSAAMQNGTLNCSSRPSRTGPKPSVKLLSEVFYITAVSEPCQTFISLSDSRLVRVSSFGCSFWNVSHGCWLRSAGAENFTQLEFLSTNGFKSTHRLRVTEGVELQGWLVKCSVNQSGLLYPNVEARVPARETNGHGWIFVFVLLIVLCSFVLVVTAKLSHCQCQPVVASDSNSETGSDAFGNGALGSEHFTESTVALSEADQLQPPCKVAIFATVTDIIDRSYSDDAESTDEDEIFNEATGHYEADGCTLVHYRRRAVQ